MTDPANINQLPGWMMIIYHWLEHQQFVASLLILMALDIFAGIMLAIGQKTLSSSISWRGGAKKATTIIILGLCATLQPYTNGVPILQPCAFYFIIAESISILEHAAALGVPLPPFLLESLEKLRQQKQIKNMPIAQQGSVIVNPSLSQPLKVEAIITQTPTLNEPPLKP